MHNNTSKKVFLWEKNHRGINVKERKNYIGFTQKNRLKLTETFTTDKFLVAEDLKEFEEALYDLASKHYMDWDTETWFDSWGLRDDWHSGARITDLD